MEMMHNTHILNQTETNEEFTFEEFYAIISKKKYWSPLINNYSQQFLLSMSIASQHMYNIHKDHPNTNKKQHSSSHSRPYASWSFEIIWTSTDRETNENCQHNVT